MKKQISILLSLLVAFSSFFVSCSENDNDFKKPSDTGGGVTDNNGHAYVDLGLSVKWATCNVGATSPWEYGGYYAWGETEEKKDYICKTYKWCNGSYDTITKYCTDSRYGIVDNKTVLDPEDDVAHVKWGGNWRMPTVKEFQELNDCIWEWTSLNGVNGYKVTGPNGNSIFLPTAGLRDGTKIYKRGEDGFFWLSLLYGNNNCAYCPERDDDSRLDAYDRYYGIPVRPVCK